MKTSLKQSKVEQEKEKVIPVSKLYNALSIHMSHDYHDLLSSLSDGDEKKSAERRASIHTDQHGQPGINISESRTVG